MSQATVTAKTGPNLQATALVLGDVESFAFQASRLVLDVVQDGGKHREYDLSGVTTVTCSVSGVNFNFTVS